MTLTSIAWHAKNCESQQHGIGLVPNKLAEDSAGPLMTPSTESPPIRTFTQC
jgi:hypothetical protein